VKERNEWVVVAVGVCYSYKYRVFLHSCYHNHSHPFALFLLLFPSSGSRTTITTKSKTTKLTTCLIGICWPQPLLRFGLYISKRILYNEFLYIFLTILCFMSNFRIWVMAESGNMSILFSPSFSVCSFTTPISHILSIFIIRLNNKYVFTHYRFNWLMSFTISRIIMKSPSSTFG
jgi:hypothetical protein